MTETSHCDVVVVGAGAAGMMCAIEAGKRGRKTVLIDHAEAPGEKIRISGGGRCNFTNLYCKPSDFISDNPHFCKSALSRYTQQDFIKLIEKHGIAWHEKTLGQLFCDQTAKEIIRMLLKEMKNAEVILELGTSINSITAGTSAQAARFIIRTNKENYYASSLVIATGGLSIPKMGATGFGYDTAKQFGLAVNPTRAALVPLLFNEGLLTLTKPFSGMAVNPVEVSCGKTVFREALLFTHRGLSGPAILQISSYWKEGNKIIINFLPDENIFEELKALRIQTPRIHLHNALASFIPKRLAEMIVAVNDAPLADLSNEKLHLVAQRIHNWHVFPIGTEGYRTAEVTAGGIDTEELSSRTFEARKIPGLYFIGEVVDVTGHLGGFNFQWAWSSGWCAGQFV